MNKRIISILRKKASKSSCGYKVGAVGFNKKGDYVCSSFNKPRYYRKGGGIHAEEDIMSKSKGIRSILICRVNPKGEFLPIHPCERCKDLAERKNIKIFTVLEM